MGRVGGGLGGVYWGPWPYVCTGDWRWLWLFSCLAGGVIPCLAGPPGRGDDGRGGGWVWAGVAVVGARAGLSLVGGLWFVVRSGPLAWSPSGVSPGYRTGTLGRGLALASVDTGHSASSRARDFAVAVPSSRRRSHTYRCSGVRRSTSSPALPGSDLARSGPDNGRCARPLNPGVFRRAADGCSAGGGNFFLGT